jgi:hypothetical protein
MIEEIKNNERLLAIIIYSNYHADGISFLTPNSFSQQLGYMNRPAGYVIKPHIHNLVKREVFLTQEVLIIKSGKIRVDLYADSKEYIESRILEKGDIILLADGGHGFEIIEQSEIIEVKQGPFCGEADKIRFEPIDISKIEIPKVN